MRREKATRWVTPNGRCKAPGRVTRASLAMRRNARGDLGRPLPIHLQCHPKALSPTSRNPDCLTYGNRALGMSFGLTWSAQEIMRGCGLRRKARFALVWVQGLRQLGCLDDALAAMAYAKHAATKRVTLEVIDNGA